MSSEQPCELKGLHLTLPWILQELKKYTRKTCGWGQHWRSLNEIRVLNERSVSNGGNLSGYAGLEILDIVSETPFSCNTVGCDWELFKWNNVINILLIGLDIFVTKQWFLTLKLRLIWRPILFLIYSRSIGDWDCSSIFESFPKKERAFSFFLLLVSVQCIDKTFFGSFRSPSHIKYYLNSQTPAILKHRGKIKVCNDDVNCAFVLLYIYIFLLKFFTLQNKAYHKTKTKDDTYNITDTSKKNDYWTN